MKHLRILECTVRDGSYVVNFQFTGDDTAIMVAGLESAGIELIEIGHGLGLNASNAGHGIAAASDHEYLEAAATTLTRAQWGTFFIPGIGRHEDLELAASFGMHFVRIGTNADRVSESQEYIEHAKRLGLYVSSNLMKSYAVPVDVLVQQAKLAQQYGADMVSLVDSAGTMVPAEVARYTQALCGELEVPIGFHGHDNLCLAVANVLAAIEAGAAVIDTTLQGFGRSGGNPPTEVVVGLLQRMGAVESIDLKRLMDVSQRLIGPLMRPKRHDPLDITAGIGGFHSSYLEKIVRYADRFRVDARDLILAVCQVERLTASDAVVEEAARRLRDEAPAGAAVHRVHLSGAQRHSERLAIGESLQESIASLAGRALSIATKTGKMSVLNIVGAASQTERAAVSHFLQEGDDYIIGSVQVGDEEQLRVIIAAADGVVDVLFVDGERKLYLDRPLSDVARRSATRSRVLAYRDTDVWARAVEHQLGALIDRMPETRVLVCGTGPLAARVGLALMERGATVSVWSQDGNGLAQFVSALGELAKFTGPAPILALTHGLDMMASIDVVVACNAANGRVTVDMVEAMDSGSLLFDAAIGGIESEALSKASSRRLRSLRPDMRAALSSELKCALASHRLAGELTGEQQLAEIPVVAAGQIGRPGDVVVDSTLHPTKVIGVADGRGTVIYEVDGEFESRADRVRQEIRRLHLDSE